MSLLSGIQVSPVYTVLYPALTHLSTEGPPPYQVLTSWSGPLMCPLHEVQLHQHHIHIIIIIWTSTRVSVRGNTVQEEANGLHPMERSIIRESLCKEGVE